MTTRRHLIGCYVPTRPITEDDAPATPVLCGCGAVLTYDQQCMDEPMCEACQAIAAQEENL